VGSARPGLGLRQRQSPGASPQLTAVVRRRQRRNASFLHVHLFSAAHGPSNSPVPTCKQQALPAHPSRLSKPWSGTTRCTPPAAAVAAFAAARHAP
jgi:hypothetical protein